MHKTRKPLFPNWKHENPFFDQSRMCGKRVGNRLKNCKTKYVLHWHRIRSRIFGLILALFLRYQSYNTILMLVPTSQTSHSRPNDSAKFAKVSAISASSVVSKKDWQKGTVDYTILLMRQRI